MKPFLFTLAAALCFASPALADPALYGYNEATSGSGTTTGTGTDNIGTIDLGYETGLSNLDGMAVQINSRCTASDGTNVRAFQRRTVLQGDNGGLDNVGS